ncbi:MAG: glycosyltransferase [Candidatus Peregrinibacteria bacterium]|nr:glycosyltransferase [Candidatus Peregrinibacteria bacterium]
MKIALVHELLTMRGGAERVLRVLADLYPDAPIYTLLYDEKKLGDWFPRDRIRTSSLQSTARALDVLLSTVHCPLGFNHHLYLSRFPKAVEEWDFSAFDVVLSSSSAFTHGIITNGHPKHLCYVHSPARYLWDRTHDILERAGRGIVGPLRRGHLSRSFHKLRTWDSEAADRPDALIAASKTVARRIELYWRRKSDVIYPPIDDVWFEGALTSQERTGYLVVSTLVPYKRIELAIEACNALRVPLKIAGEGPDRRRLEQLAGPTITFLGFQTEEELRTLYASAEATLFPGEEDFGLVPVESMACGTPVLAFGRGGARETVIEGVTGMFFSEPTGASLAALIEQSRERKFESERCRARAKEFSRERFERSIQKEIHALVEK